MYTYGSIRDYTNKIEMAIDVQFWGIDSTLEWTRVGIIDIMWEHNMWCNAWQDLLIASYILELGSMCIYICTIIIFHVIF